MTTPPADVPVLVAAAGAGWEATALERLGDWEASVERRATPGGSSRASVIAQLEALERAFAPVLPPVPR